jgi:hypothetical protein
LTIFRGEAHLAINPMHDHKISEEPMNDTVTLGKFMLSRGIYFVASKVDKTLTPEEGKAPFSINIAGAVRSHTPDYRFFIVDIFGVAEDFDSDEDTTIGHRVMRLEDLLKATFFADFESLKANAGEYTGNYESLNID